MAVKVVKGGNGILGNLGSIATLAGMFIPGAQWLTPLGAGMSAVNSIMNGGNADSTIDALGKLKDVMTGWQNPASGNIAKTAGTVASAAKGISPYESDEELARKWGGVNTWQR
ncbi:MAG: hypothetical protein IJR63_09240 [Synergistaceae bacterium]|nr:hypothetical protein [Synergistaceae bacterium]